jgi:cyclophilin family peptidyl-prolyl cis-trans isomerase
MHGARAGALRWCLLGCGWLIVGAAMAAGNTPTLAETLAGSTAAEWRAVDPDQTLYMDLPQGRVVIELAPRFAPLHVANIRALVREKYFDGLAILRAQDNFVVQWGDPDDMRPLGRAQAELDAEFTVPLDTTPFVRLPDRDGYAPQVGFSDGFAAARDPRAKQQWLIHCYGAIGVARGNDPRSGNGSSLYAVIGQAPRQLDRNIAVVGRVLRGMELLSTRPRGSGAMGFYEQPAERLSITAVRFASELPEAERLRLQVLRSDSRSFATLLEARRNRHDEWMRNPPGFLEVCNVPVPGRLAP